MNKSSVLNGIIILNCAITLVTMSQNIAEIYATEKVLTTQHPIREVSAEVRATTTDEKTQCILYDIQLSRELQQYTYEICQENHIDYKLILAIMKLESNYNNELVNYNTNGTHDVSLMQLNSAYHYWQASLIGLQEKDFDPHNSKQNINAGIMVYKFGKDYWENKGIVDHQELTKRALLSYNRGIFGAINYIKKNGLDHAYTSTILNNVEKLSGLVCNARGITR